MSETTEMGPAAAQRVAVGAQVRAARESMGLTQKAAAERIGVSNTTINNIEKGKAGQAAKLKMVLDFFNLHAHPECGFSEEARFAGRLASKWVDAHPPEDRLAAFDEIVGFMREKPQVRSDP